MKPVPDGQAALSAARECRPGLILSDVMMPGLDGFGLLREIRADELLKTVPVILLSARAGEESRVEGLEHGADDYLIKPFSARELLARVAAHLEMAQIRKENEKALRESEEKFKTLVENSPDIISRIDRNHRHLFVSAAVTQATGIKPEHYLGKTNAELGMPEELCRQWDEKLEEVFNTGRSVTMEFAFPGPTGVRHYSSRLVPEYAPDGSVQSILGLARDITERKQIEITLRRGEKTLAEAQRVAHVGSWEWNIQTGEVKWSAELYRICGLEPDSFTPTIHSFADYIHPDDREIVNKVIQTVSTGMPVNFDFRIVRADGSVRILDTRGEVTDFDESGRPRLMMGINQDITERKQAEEELIRAREELELRVRERTAELERKNRELQEFAFVASHDLTEPLRKIQTFGDLLKAKGADHLDESERDYISRMTGAAKRMQELLDALLRYSRIETKGEDFRPTRLKDVAMEVVGDLEVGIRKAEAKVEVAELPTIVGDRNQFRQLFQNLLSNSLKYRRSGARPYIRIYGKNDHGKCRIIVEDNGIGFDEKYLEKIFQPFQRLHGKNEYSGTGIGLAICKKIVERHGGTITAKSTLGVGSTFIVTLPVNGGKR